MKPLLLSLVVLMCWGCASKAVTIEAGGYKDGFIIVNANACPDGHELKSINLHGDTLLLECER